MNGHIEFLSVPPSAFLRREHDGKVSAWCFSQATTPKEKRKEEEAAG
jgi:hypothetical protein